MTADARVTNAAEFLDGARKRKVTQLPPSVLVRELAETRRLLGQVLEVATEIGLLAPPPEEWRPVVGWEEAYEVSNRGQVFSLARHTPAGQRGGRMLKPHIDRHGYPVVSLKLDGRRKTVGVHCLVADAFLGPLPEGQERRHKDGNRLNCSLTNLEFGTPSDNRQDAIRHGTHPRGSKHPNTWLTEEIVEEIRARYAAGGISQRALGAEYGLPQSSVSCIISGKSWVRADPVTAKAWLDEDQALTVTAALDDAVAGIRDRAAHCGECLDVPDGGFCDGCEARMARVDLYVELAGQLATGGGTDGR